MKVSNPSDVRLLDNPIWYALATEQASLAQGNRLAKRFPPDVAPFAAMRNQSAVEFQALEEVLSGDAAALFLDSPPALPSAWTMQHSGEMYQMIFEGMPPAEPQQVFRQLTEADVPEMLALTKLTEPGPFLPRTIQLGSYFGVHEHGHLVAMAGERLRITGFHEVSAVCTHPDYRGRGYGNALMSAVISRIIRRGETPFLHVRTENAAVRLYEKLGFTVRARLYLAVVQHARQPVTIENDNVPDRRKEKAPLH
jgi:ribosomal protein S18 acetylase RimI-like enzyme